MVRTKRIVGLTAGLLVTLCGCGSPQTQYVTRSEEGNLNPDALILAARDATGTRVPLALAKTLDAALGEARKAIPELANSRAALDYEPHKIQVTVSATAPWRTTWEAGQWRTGVEEIDAVLEPLAPISVKNFSSADDQHTYEITFEKWIRAKAVAYSLYNKNAAISRAAVVSPAAASDGDLVYVADSASGAPQFETNGKTFHRVGNKWQAVDAPSVAR